MNGTPSNATASTPALFLPHLSSEWKVRWPSMPSSSANHECVLCQASWYAIGARSFAEKARGSSVKLSLQLNVVRVTLLRS